MPLLSTFGAASARGWRSSIKGPVIVFNEATGPGTSATGGWSYQHGDGGWITSGVTSNAVYTNAHWWSSGSIVTNNNIDTTGAVSVTIKVQAYSDNDYGYAWINFPGGGQTLVYPGRYSVPYQEMTIPVTGGGGVGKILFGAANNRQYSYLYAFTINY